MAMPPRLDCKAEILSPSKGRPFLLHSPLLSPAAGHAVGHVRPNMASARFCSICDKDMGPYVDSRLPWSRCGYECRPTSHENRDAAKEERELKAAKERKAEERAALKAAKERDAALQPVPPMLVALMRDHGKPVHLSTLREEIDGARQAMRVNQEYCLAMPNPNKGRNGRSRGYNAETGQYELAKVFSKREAKVSPEVAIARSDDFSGCLKWVVKYGTRGHVAALLMAFDLRELKAIRLAVVGVEFKVSNDTRKSSCGWGCEHCRQLYQNDMFNGMKGTATELASVWARDSQRND